MEKSKEQISAQRRVSQLKTSLKKQEREAARHYAAYKDTNDPNENRQAQYWYNEAEKTKVLLAEAEQKLQNIISNSGK